MGPTKDSKVHHILQHCISGSTQVRMEAGNVVLKVPCKIITETMLISCFYKVLEVFTICYSPPESHVLPQSLRQPSPTQCLLLCFALEYSSGPASTVLMEVIVKSTQNISGMLF